MKMTLLEMVKNVLSATESDEVDSISDTLEASMAAEIIKAVYFQMLQWSTTPELNNAFFPLEGLSDTDYPTYLKLPDNVDELFWFKYDRQESTDTQAKYGNIKYCSPEDFFNRLQMRDLSETEVVELQSMDGIPLYLQTDKGPEFYTILNDKYIVCDSYDSDVDATLQASKTVASGSEHPTFTMSDSFIPSLDANLFPYLLAESKAVAMVELKQTSSAKHESIAREQKVRHQNERHRFKDKNAHTPRTDGPNYSRRRR